MKVSFRLDEKEGFVSTVDGKTQISLKNSISNNTSNFSPTEMLLLGMGGCSSDDVVNILSKMKADIRTYSFEIEAERNQEPPKVITKAHMKYLLTGDIDVSKVRKAVNLSLSKYCSVSILARRGGVDLTYELVINGKSYGVEEPEAVLAA